MAPRVNGRIVRALRHARGLAAVALAERVGINRHYLSHVEAGRRHPSRTLGQRLADALDVPLDVLTGQQPVIDVLREAARIVPAALAVRVGLTPGQLLDLEAGRLPLDHALAAVIARQLGVDVDVLYPTDVARDADDGGEAA